MSKYMTRRTRDVYDVSISEGVKLSKFRPTKSLTNLIYINKRKRDNQQSSYM